MTPANDTFLTSRPDRHAACRRSPRLARRQRLQRRAFTMIEAMFACMLLIFGFIPIMAVLVMSQRVEQQGLTRTIAYNVARYEMEQLQARTWLNLPVTADTTFTIPTTLTSQLPYGVTLTGKYNITTPSVSPSTTLTNIREITVSVSWTNVVNHVGAAYKSTTAGTSTATPTSEVRISNIVSQQFYQSGS